MVGLSVNLNVLDAAEKRVKSRFSFRQVRKTLLYEGDRREDSNLMEGGAQRERRRKKMEGERQMAVIVERQ